MSSQIERLQIDLFRKNGYAEIIKEKNQSVHGILHEISEKELSILDEIEVFYGWEQETIELYDGNKIDNVFVCCRKYDENKTEKNELPSERYMFLIDGCMKFGVDQKYVDFIKSHECIPRISASDYESFPVPEEASTRTFFLEEIQQADGCDGRDYLITLNGKVLKCNVENTFVKHWIKFGLDNLETHTARMLYDPLFGDPSEHLEDYTREHCNYIENMLYQKSKSNMMKDFAVCIGFFPQHYKD
ncbi:hypothetical protein CTEN210_14533 [Chaetoceros tenuissimus]|uniref:Gamma-glutamylcyclotransferase AIG2-like domain-containing protein n=1 Tax=Chaetoceros tenuissimus TaxID=426638 RepID=A0AAD3D5X3_9STRA|nr:hypothetical protein CTEN210_14533 [Chaetoceros tenuissimus]